MPRARAIVPRTAPENSGIEPGVGKHGRVYQFLVLLNETDPLVWRRIQVPPEYSFWDLHVAIQDAMGWTDTHLHEFRVAHPRGGKIVRIGIPDEEYPEDAPLKTGWKLRIADYFDHRSLPARYVYDFGDDWNHTLVFEGWGPATNRVRYPRCVAGERACPPEDCGGPHGYAELVKAIRSKSHRGRKELLDWVGSEFDPDAFDRRRVRFDDPKSRLRRLLEE